MVADPLSALRAQVEDCIADPQLEPAEREVRLRSLRDRLSDVAGVADRYLSSVGKLREAEASVVARDRLWARGIADLREQLIEEEGESADELDEAGFVTHEELDHLEEEGLLAEAVGTMRKAWDKSRHPRGRAGRFTEGHFFKQEEGSILVHRDRLRPTRTDPPEHVALARRKAMEAARGLRDKRDPLDVREEGDGTLSIIDGNSTYEALKDDLEHFRVKIGGPEKGGEAAVQRTSGEIAEGAARVEPQVTATMKAVTSELGGSLEGLEHKLKSVQSIEQKIQRKQEKYPGMTADRAGRKVRDALRYTATFPPDQYTDGVMRTMAALDAQGFHLSESRNYWGSADDYDGFHAILTGPRDVSVELQFHTPQSFDVKTKQNHALFESFRSSQDPHERYELYARMLANAAQVEVPVGVESLGPPQASPSEEARERRGEV